MTRINVTEKHINEGSKGDCMLCPIALAIVEQITSCVNAEVGDDMIYVNFRQGCQEAKSPKEVADFILRFDHGHEVSPFSFELEWD